MISGFESGHWTEMGRTVLMGLGIVLRIYTLCCEGEAV